MARTEDWTLRIFRERLKMRQDEFWARVFVSQSMGSRYESGTMVPDTVRVMLDLVYKQNIDVANLPANAGDILNFVLRNEKFRQHIERELEREKRQ